MAEEVKENRETESKDNSPTTQTGEGAADFGKKHHRGLRNALIILAMVAAVVVVLFAAHIVILFRHGIYLHNTERIALELTGNEADKLDYFTNLKEADLRGSEPFREIARWSRRHPETDVLYTVNYPGTLTYGGEAHTVGLSYDEKEKTVDMTGVKDADGLQTAIDDYLYYAEDGTHVRLDFDALADAVRDQTLADELDALFATCREAIDVTVEGDLEIDGWRYTSYKALTERYPDIAVSGSLLIDGISCPLDAEAFDFSACKSDQYAELNEAASSFQNLTSVDFGTEKDGHRKLSGVSAFAAAHPEIETAYAFSAFGKDLDFHTEKLDFNHITMDDQGKEVRELLESLPDVTYLDMDFCGVDDEHMAGIRDDFPDVKVVWRIWFGTAYSVRTDVEKILASAPQVGGMLTPETTKSLIYCTDLKYLDIGHNEGLRDLYFVRYMPNLEVLICMWGSITDISPLADCPHLEFLEIFTNSISDISPLKDLHELKHLNMCWNYGISDLSPIYGLTQLERLWIGTTTSIPHEQVVEFQKLAPDCEINDWCGDPHTNWRWGTERYALLQEQFGYVNYEYEFYWRDPLYYPHDDAEE